MPRLPDREALYQIFQQFVTNCLLNDTSLLWPDRHLWTAQNVSELKRRTFENPIWGHDLTFEQKLMQQVGSDKPELWGVMADSHYLYYLPSAQMHDETKRANIAWCAERAGLSLPGPAAPIWQALNQGFARTGQRYHIRILQLWLILLFAEYVKHAVDREAILRDRQKMQVVLDDLLQSIPKAGDRAYDMRHALLHMAFPDYYEPFISTGDKQRIVKAYWPLVGGPQPADIDEALRQVRPAKGSELGRPDFNFYEEAIKKEWQEGANVPTPPPLPPTPPQPARQGGMQTGAGLASGPVRDPDVLTVLAALRQTHNIILYGPPGTGKTYIARKAAEAFVQPQTKAQLSEPAIAQRIVEDLTLYDVLALSMYVSGRDTAYSVPDLYAQPLVKARFEQFPIKHPQQSVWGYLQNHTGLESKTVKVSRRWEPFLFDKDNSSRWSLTEAGRAYVEGSLAEQLRAWRTGSAPASSVNDYVSWVTFHQSYAYEDFVEGLRPRTSEEDPSAVTYEIVPGVFRRLCARAANDPRNNYVLMIDEINRGNIAKIMGELITLLEDDKRAGQSNAIYLTLPYSGILDFTVPANLYIIGTMNTADRSIALLDVALRRRFAFAELMPRPELLDEIAVQSGEISVALGSVLRGLNNQIRQHLDRDHQIGHSYFLKLSGAADAVATLEFVWNNQIMPLLEEYFYSQPDKLAQILSAFGGEAETADGSSGTQPGHLRGDDLLFALSKLAEQQ